MAMLSIFWREGKNGTMGYGKELSQMGNGRLSWKATSNLRIAFESIREKI